MNSPESFPPQVDEMLPFPHADEVSVGEIVCRDLLECAPDVPLHEAALLTAVPMVPGTDGPARRRILPRRAGLSLACTHPRSDQA